MDDERKISNTIIGLAGTGGAVTGLVSFIVALLPLFNGDFMAAGVCFLASGLSFGLLANAVFRA
jgi:hypothetical protein